MWSVLRSYNQDRWINELSSAREAEKRWRYNYVELRVVGSYPTGNGVTTEAKESPLLEAVTGERLVKTLLTEEDFACSDL
jgi:hypothetical protein